MRSALLLAVAAVAAAGARSPPGGEAGREFSAVAAPAAPAPHQHPAEPEPPLAEPEAPLALVEHASFRRPIITGCLAACGGDEQSCVTQCQVCVESHRCKTLDHKCGECKKEVDEARMWSKMADNEASDGGGRSLLHDGIQMRLRRATLDGLDARRGLRKARGGVLQAQRQAEWAAEERLESARQLRSAKQALEHTRKDVTQWKLRNARKLKEMRTRAAEQRTQRMRAERQLAKSKEELHRAKMRLDKAENATHKHPHAKSHAIKEQEVTRALHEEKELRRQVKAEEEKVKKAENAVEKRMEDAGWLDRGLRHEVAKAKAGVEEAVKKLRAARGMERVSRDRLQKAKTDYKKCADGSETSKVKVEEYEHELEEHPLPTYVPQAVKAMQMELQSAGRRTLAGGFSVILALLVTL